MTDEIDRAFEEELAKLDNVFIPEPVCLEGVTPSPLTLKPWPKPTRRLFPFKGGYLTVPEAADSYGISRSTVWMRIRTQGMTLEEAVTTPLMQGGVKRLKGRQFNN